MKRFLVSLGGGWGVFEKVFERRRWCLSGSVSGRDAWREEPHGRRGRGRVAAGRRGRGRGWRAGRCAQLK